MPDDAFLRDFLRGVYYQVPYLIAYAVGVFLALASWRRYPVPSLFTFLACAMKITAALAFPLSAALLLRRADFGTFETVTVLTTIFDASAYGLLLFAIFSSRVMPRPPPFAWPEDAEPVKPAAPPEPPPPLPSGGAKTGIQERK